MLRPSKESERNKIQRRSEPSDKENLSEDTSRTQAGADKRTFGQIIGVNIPPMIDERLTEVYRKLVDTTPLPRFFDYGHMFESYVWRAVFLTSFTLGIRFGNLDAVSYVLLGIFGKYLIFLLTYMVIPPFMIFFSKRMQKELTIHEQRIILIIVAAQLGVYSSVINQHYVIIDTAAPSYFLPGLVGLTVQLVGPRFGHNRIQFLAVSVGSAFTAGVVLMAVFHDISFAALIGLIISAVCATINLQLMVYSIRQGGIDMMGGHITAVMMAVYMHLVFSRLFGEYSEEEKSTPSVTKPLLYS
ncbi:unnamed protein product [Cylicocyclus nassatus]|uniref:Uncharacterized protein n=1 Tax=Cylicocyclus nassatus TaxID=53992 RepID=A0AA36H3G5_CYLNA|nr:unnamed protein product [Cylicocyclus nassatus]